MWPCKGLHCGSSLDARFFEMFARHGYLNLLGTELGHIIPPLGLICKAVYAVVRDYIQRIYSNTNSGVFHALLTSMNMVVVSFLSEGRFSKVWLLSDNSTRRYFALKIVDVQPYGEFLQSKSSSLRVDCEAMLLSRLRDEHILKLYFWARVPGSLMLVLEYVRDGSLVDYVNQHGAFSDPAGCDIAWQLAKAACFLHSRSILHRDFKPDNVLVSFSHLSNCVLKVADFGLSRHCGSDRLCCTVVGTPQYMAPEVHLLKTLEINEKRVGYSFLADMWSIGVILYAIHAVVLPFDGDHITKDVLKGVVPYDEDDWVRTPRVRLLVQHLLEYDLTGRYDSERLLDVCSRKEFDPLVVD